MEPELELWAREALTTRKTLRTLLGTATGEALNPAAAVGMAAARVFRPDTPVEIFSDAMPPRAKRSRLLPMDGVLSEYSPGDRTIRIFPKSIAAVADSKFRCSAGDLEKIVRLHMYSRAIVHCATSADHDRVQMADYPAGAETDWAQFVDERSQTFADLDPDLTGFLANLITWKVVRTLQNQPHLRSAFKRVLRRQPEAQRVPADLLRRIDGRTDLAPVLEYVQGEYDCPHSGAFGLRMRIDALLSECARPKRSPTLSRYAAADVRSRPDAAVRSPATTGA